MIRVKKVCCLAITEVLRTSRHKRYRLLAIILMLFVMAGVRILSNTASSGIYGHASDVEWNVFRKQLANLLATYYYILPLIGILTVYDVVDRRIRFGIIPTLSEHDIRTHEIYLGTILGRLFYFVTIAALSFITGFSVAVGIMIVRGLPLGSLEVWRSILILINVEMLGLTFFGLAVAIAYLTGDARQSMIVNMSVLAFTIVAVTIISDIVLYYSIGPMPLPGTLSWAKYLNTAQGSAGTNLYMLSPTETFLTITTFLAGAVKLSPSSILKFMLPLTLQTVLAFVAFASVFCFTMKLGKFGT